MSGDRRKRGSLRWWFAGSALAAVAVAFLVLTVSGIGKNLVYYWGPTEVKAAGDRAVGATIRLGGLVALGSLKPATGSSALEFDVIDRRGECLHVKCSSVPPQMFRERIGVVVEGTMTKAGHFESRRLMVSHDNEYRVPGDSGQVVDESKFTCGGAKTVASAGAKP
jgi:cytochrome c-type biogenesis protein CcmE